MLILYLLSHYEFLSLLLFVKDKVFTSLFLGTMEINVFTSYLF